MNNLKLFQTHSEYDAFVSGGTMVKPNVSHCITENEVHYNPWVRPNLCYRYYSEHGTYLLCDNKGRILRLINHGYYVLGWQGVTTKLYHDESDTGHFFVAEGAFNKYGVSPDYINIFETAYDSSNNTIYLKDNKFTWEGTDYVFINGTWTPSLPGGQFIDPNEEIHEK